MTTLEINETLETIAMEVTESTIPASAAQSETQKPTISEKSKIDVQPVLQKLFELYPHLFGSVFLPLKLGTYQDLMAAHPQEFKKDSLKAALGFHARSTRYLQCVADGKKRHDLQGNAVEDVSPEHVYLALLELFRRRQNRSKIDLRPTFRSQLIAAFVVSGLSRQDYQLRVQTNEAEATLLLEEALAEYDATFAKQTALKRAFESSGKTPAEFAEMYGLNQNEVLTALNRQ
jgi:ProP effector